ncbi:hypothetical protein [Mycolicibacterium conceptionense]|uniref:hypothetical protein n=1 Tax=Mycolicibacterium conceptionense TaxID=451644 RepID=UPI000A4B6D5E|nr:hypothetical protein [Mycolicibacterium conceptionense]
MSAPFTTSAAASPPVIAAPFGKSAMPRIEHRSAAAVRATITNTFDDLDDFVVLAGTPEIESGRLAGEGVVRHRDQMATDDYLVSAVIGEWEVGKTRLVTCADESFAHWYGIEIETGAINNKLHIIKGHGAPALLDGGILSVVDKFKTINQTFTVGDEVGVWWDREYSTIRAYLNGVEKITLPVPRYELPHGSGFRYWGAAQGVDVFLGLLNEGVKFSSITARDYLPPAAPNHVDTFDSDTSLGNWTLLDSGVAINRHLFAPNSIGPDNVAFTDAAILWGQQLASDGVKVTITAARYGAGKLTVPVCSNAAMTSWMGVQIESGLINNKVHVVRGTGPTDYSYVGETAWRFTPTGEVLSIVYDDERDIIGCYPGHNLASPIVQAPAAGLAAHGAGNRWTGLMWETALLTPGVQPTRWEAYER